VNITVRWRYLVTVGQQLLSPIERSYLPLIIVLATSQFEDAHKPSSFFVSTELWSPLLASTGVAQAYLGFHLSLSPTSYIHFTVAQCPRKLSGTLR
jgi:hypothetical protein